MTGKRALYGMILTLALFTAACSNNGNSVSVNKEQGTTPSTTMQPSGKIDIFKLPSPVELSIAKKVNPDAKLPQGDTLDNNQYSRYLFDKSNVKFNVLWSAAGQDYDQKIKLAIASNDLPDVMIVDETVFRSLAKANQLADLTDVYNNYASPLLKELYASTDNKALDKATIKGKLLAFPNISIQADGPSMLWVRKDWLDKLGLQPPKTVDDMAIIAKAFVDRDPDGDGKPDTIGLPGNSQEIAITTGTADFTGLFAAYNAFPGMWMKDSNGKVVYGSTTSEAKEALGKLKELYAAGLVDKEFVLQKDPAKLIASGKAGMFFGPWYSPWFPLNDSVKNDPKANWQPYLIADAKGQVNSRTIPVSSQFVVVKKGQQHPEALMIYINDFTNIQRYADPDATKLDLSVDSSFYPLYATFDNGDAVNRKHDMLKKALDGKMTRDQLTPEMQKHYDSWQRVLKNPAAFDIGDWMAPYAYIYGGGALTQKINYVDSVFTATTTTMQKRWVNLQKLEQETYFKIVLGDKSLDDFDQFVTDWKSQGGDEIIKEIETELQSQ
jgi:putative aldouronate transport system substrate-binding protein